MREHDSLNFAKFNLYFFICELFFQSSFDFFFPATVVVWDSQVKDGYKRKQAPAVDGCAAGDTPTAPVGWDGKKTSGVVEELLRNSTDKAYGASGETEWREHLRYCMHIDFDSLWQNT